MVDIGGERDPEMDAAELEGDPARRTDPEPVAPGAEEGMTPAGVMPAAVGGASPSGQLPIAAGLVETSDAVETPPAEGEETGDPDEWRVPREDLFPPTEEQR